jgi:peroxisomal membrane protein 2
MGVRSIGEGILFIPKHLSFLFCISILPLLATSLSYRNNLFLRAKQLGVAGERARTPRMMLDGFDSRGGVELWQQYLDLLDEAPLTTKAVTAGVIIGSGDWTAQVIESTFGKPDNKEERGVVDLARVARWAAFGFFLQAPWNHFFYMALDGALPPTAEPFTATTGVKVAIDQFGQAPIFTAVIFMFFAIVEGRGIAAGKRQIEEKLYQVLLKNWAVFLPATFINLAFLPNQLRVLFLNGVFFFWTIFLSLTVNAKNASGGTDD